MESLEFLSVPHPCKEMRHTHCITYLPNMLVERAKVGLDLL